MPTPEQTKELLPIIIAYAEGKQIQFRFKCEEKWEDYTGNSLGFYDNYEYRIKPEKKVVEGWLNIYFDGSGLLYPTKEQADFRAGVQRAACVYYSREYEEGEGL